MISKYIISCCCVIIFSFTFSCQAEEKTVTSLTHVGHTYFPHGWGAGIAKKENFLYVTCGESHRLLMVYDISDIKKPKFVSVPFEDSMGSVHFHNPVVDGNWLIGHALWHLVPFDISDPRNPKRQRNQYLKKIYTNKFDPFILKDKYLFYGANSTEKGKLNACILQVYKIREPFEIELVASLDLTPQLSEEAKTAIQQRDKKSGERGFRWEAMSLGRYRGGNIIVDGNTLHIPFLMGIFGVDVSDPLHPVMIYKHENGEQIRGMALKGKTLFLCTTDFNFGASDYEIASKNKVSVIDITNPKDIRKIGEYRGLEIPQSMLLDKNQLYLVGTEPLSEEERKFNGVMTDVKMRMVLHLLDISKASSPKCLGTYRFSDRQGLLEYCCQGLVLEKGHLFVGDSATGVWVLDVSKPSQITKTDCVHTVFEAQGVSLVGDYAYVRNSPCFSYNMYTFNILKPEKPELVGWDANIPVDTSYSWFVPGSRNNHTGKGLYVPSCGVTLPGDRIVVMDIEDPSAPHLEKLIPLPGKWKIPWGGGLAEHKDYLMVFAIDPGVASALLVYKKENDGLDLKCVKELKIPGISGDGNPRGPRGVFCVNGDKLYIITLEKSETGAVVKHLRYGTPYRQPDVTLTVVDIANPPEPKILKTTPLHKGFPYESYLYGAVACRGDYLYIIGEVLLGAPIDGRSPKQLYIYNVADPKKPAFVSDLEMVSSWGGIQDLTVLEPYPALVIQDYGYGLNLVDVSDPKNPTLLWREPVPDVKWQGRYPKCGFGSGTFRNGYLYVPHIARLDIYKVNLGARSELKQGTRMAKVNTIVDKARTAPAWNCWVKGALQAHMKTVQYYYDQGNLLAAEDWATELSRIMERKASCSAPEIMESSYVRSAIKLDGDNTEWQEIPGYKIDDSNSTVKLQWDDNFLYFFFDIEDPEFQPEKNIFDGDRMEIYLNTSLRKGPRDYSPSDYQYVIAADGRMHIHSNNPRFKNSEPPHSRAAFKQTERGYRLEVALSHEETWVVPSEGVQVAWMCLLVNKNYGDTPLKDTGDTNFYRVIGAEWPHMYLKSVSKPPK